MARPCVYVNTSIVIRALSPSEPGSLEAQRLLRECCRRCRCVWSTVHALEGFRSDLARFFFHGYLASLGAEYAEVDEDWAVEQSRAYIGARGLSRKRLVDVAHMVAAKLLGCRYILARDSFMRRHANNLGLIYINWETHGGRCPCPSQGRGRSRSRASRSGGRGGTRPGSSSTSSQGSRGARSERRPGGSSTSGRKKKSPTRKRRRSSGSSPLGRRLRRGAGRQGPSRRPRRGSGG